MQGLRVQPFRIGPRGEKTSSLWGIQGLGLGTVNPKPYRAEI